MKEKIIALLKDQVNLSSDEILNLIEVPKNPALGDYAFPCFTLAKQLKKNPSEIALELSKKIKSKEFEKIESKGPYLNFFISKNLLTEQTLKSIQKLNKMYGYSNIGKNKKIIIEFSSPNIAKPFGIGHLRSTIIGNSLVNIHSFLGYKVIRINYLGDWGTQFGKILLGYKKFGDPKELEKSPIKHLYDIYVKVNENKEFEQGARDWFKKLEEGDKESLKLWRKFRDLSIKEFNKLYGLLGIKFDVISGESYYLKGIDKVINELKNKDLLEKSQRALIVSLEKYNLGICLIKKSDEASLYTIRDISAAINRYNKYKFHKMIYEVGAEQKLHFQQVFKILELLGNNWARNLIHVEHGLYLDKDGKKLATRKGKTIFMEDILHETINLAKAEITKREKLNTKELEKRALEIGKSAIFFGDLKNYRSNDIVFDIQRFLSFEGDTGPYLLYAYARAKSILRKAKYKKKKFKITSITDKEKILIKELANFPEIVLHSYHNLSPNIIANYTYQISQLFNEFYHTTKVIGSEKQDFLLVLVDSFSIVLKNALSLLGINVIERM